jgi:MFS family permease
MQHIEPPATDDRQIMVAHRTDYRSLFFCLLGNLFLRAAAAAAGTLISLYLASLQAMGYHITAQLVSVTGAVFYTAELLGAPTFGSLCDIKGRRPFMLLGPVLGGVAVQFILIAPTIPLVMLSRFMQGLSTATSVPSTLSYLSAEAGDDLRLRGRVMSAFEVASIVGMAGGFATGGILWDAFNHSAFAIVIMVYALSALLLWFVRDLPLPEPCLRPGLITGWQELIRLASARRLIPAWVAVNAIVGLWFSHLDFQMGKADDPVQLLVGGYTGKEIGFYTAGAALLFVFGIALWAFTFGRLRATQIMSISLVGLFGLVGTLYLLNHSTGENGDQALLFLCLSGGCLLVVSGFTPAALSYLAGIAEECPTVRGGVMGLYSVFLGIGYILGSLVGGPFAQYGGVDGMIVLTAILGVLAGLCVLVLMRHESEDSNCPTPSSGGFRLH